MQKPIRPILNQEFLPFSLLVKASPDTTPLSTSNLQAQTYALYDAMLISVPKLGPNAAAGAVILGGANVDATKNNGLEILPGVPVMLSINNERQLYEVQAPIIDTSCLTPEAIPFVVWDVSTVYLAALVDTVVGIILFKAAFV